MSTSRCTVRQVTDRREGRSQQFGDGRSPAGRETPCRACADVTIAPVRGTSPPRRWGAEEFRVTMGATLGWPAVAVLGFLMLNVVVVVLGTSSTARYEFDRNGVRERQRTGAHRVGAHPAGSRAESRPAGAADVQARPQ